MAKNRKKTGASKIHRELHKRIKRYCKTKGHEWEVRSTRNGYAYYLDGERIYSTHPSNYLSPDLRQAFIRAGIPREVIGLETASPFARQMDETHWQKNACALDIGDLEWGDTEHDESLSDDLDNAQAGDLVWVDGHNVLITKRLEHPELQDRCFWCEGKGEAEHYDYDEETDETLETTTTMSCFGCQNLKTYIEFQPNGEDKRYAHYVGTDE